VLVSWHGCACHKASHAEDVPLCGIRVVQQTDRLPRALYHGMVLHNSKAAHALEMLAAFMCGVSIVGLGAKHSDLTSLKVVLVLHPALVVQYGRFVVVHPYLAQVAPVCPRRRDGASPCGHSLQIFLRRRAQAIRQSTNTRGALREES